MTLQWFTGLADVDPSIVLACAVWQGWWLLGRRNSERSRAQEHGRNSDSPSTHLLRGLQDNAVPRSCLPCWMVAFPGSSWDSFPLLPCVSSLKTKHYSRECMVTICSLEPEKLKWDRKGACAEGGVWDPQLSVLTDYSHFWKLSKLILKHNIPIVLFFPRIIHNLWNWRETTAHSAHEREEQMEAHWEISFLLHFLQRFFPHHLTGNVLESSAPFLSLDS